MNQDMEKQIQELHEWLEDAGRRRTPQRKEMQRQYLSKLNGHRTPDPGENAAALKRAETLLKQTFPRGQARTEAERRTLLEREAKASAAIEGELGEENAERHAEALRLFLRRPLNQDSLTRLHREMMEGQEHAQPGQYRTVNVHVGLYRPPEHPRVKRLMDMLFLYLRKTPDSRIAAAWGHAQFEAIHPFADGNGRTGRAMIQAIIQAPLPVSEWILERRQQYYRMLGARWEQYLAWFLEGIQETCRRTLRGRN